VFSATNYLKREESYSESNRLPDVSLYVILLELLLYSVKIWQHMSIFANKVSREMHYDRPLEKKQMLKPIHLVKLHFSGNSTHDNQRSTFSLIVYVLISVHSS
jgi:hypothetical protein